MPRYETPDDSLECDWLDQTDEMYPPEEELPSDLNPEELLSARAQDTLQRYRQAAIRRAEQRQRARHARLQQAAARSAKRVTPVTPLRICAALEGLVRTTEARTAADAKRALALVAQLCVQRGLEQARTTMRLVQLLADAQLESPPADQEAIRGVHALVLRYQAQLRSRA